jgi:hypothetical protein
MACRGIYHYAVEEISEINTAPSDVGDLPRWLGGFERVPCAVMDGFDGSLWAVQQLFK